MKDQLIIKMALDAWNAEMQKADKLLNALTDEQLQNEVAPNRNRGIYLLGHLTAVHDKMLPLLGLGNGLYPNLYEIFVTNPDKAKSEVPTASELRQYWKNVNSKLATLFNSLQPDQWFSKHNSVSAEDFSKEPHRNKLNVVISRTNHLSYHVGQLALLKAK